jgi:type IV fimbrial biogenesis protein FimT
MRRKKAIRAGSAGFTLYELMMVLAIVGVGVALAIPNMRSFLWNNRLTGAANDMLTAVHRARSESIKQHVQTIMCFSADPSAGVPVCNGNGTQGWVIFTDANNNGQADAATDVILRHGALPTTLSVKTTPAGNKGYLAFNSAGFARDIAIGTDLAGVVICDSRGNVPTTGPTASAARGLTISPTGRPKVTRIVADIAGPPSGDPNLAGCP